MIGDGTGRQAEETCRLHGTLFHSRGNAKPSEGVEQSNDLTYVLEGLSGCCVRVD